MQLLYANVRLHHCKCLLQLFISRLSTPSLLRPKFFFSAGVSFPSFSLGSQLRQGCSQMKGCLDDLVDLPLQLFLASLPALARLIFCPLNTQCKVPGWAHFKLSRPRRFLAFFFEFLGCQPNPTVPLGKLES